MQQSTLLAYPTIPEPFATSATGSYITSIGVTQSTSGNGRLSWALGIPPECMQTGGIPPFGQDENYVTQVFSQWIQAMQVGAAIVYNSTFQTTIGGYPKSAVVNSATTFGRQWLSTGDNNTTNPDTGGAGWQLISAQNETRSGSSSIAAGSTTTTVTFTPAFTGGVPKVVITDNAAGSWSPTNVTMYGTSNTTTTQTTVVAFHWNGSAWGTSSAGAVDFDWLATHQS